MAILAFLASIGSTLLSGVTWLIASAPVAGRWAVNNWRLVLVIVAVIIAFIGSVIVWNHFKKRPSVDIKTVQKINSANRKERLDELRSTVENNQDTITDVQKGIALQDVNVVEKNAAIDARVKDADAKITAAQASGHNVTGPELEKILMGEQ